MKNFQDEGRIFKYNKDNKELYLVLFTIFDFKLKEKKALVVIQDIDNSIYDLYEENFGIDDKDVYQNLFNKIDEMCSFYKIKKRNIEFDIKINIEHLGGINKNNIPVFNFYKKEFEKTGKLFGGTTEVFKYIHLIQEQSVEVYFEKKHSDIFTYTLNINKVKEGKENFYYYGLAYNKGNIQDVLNNNKVFLLEEGKLKTLEDVKKLINFYKSKFGTFESKFIQLNNNKKDMGDSLEERSQMEFPKNWE